MIPLPITIVYSVRVVPSAEAPHDNEFLNAIGMGLIPKPVLVGERGAIQPTEWGIAVVSYQTNPTGKALAFAPRVSLLIRIVNACQLSLIATAPFFCLLVSQPRRAEEL
mmetsp:Transcript_3607/g.5271  ORF Transcript_3607/g.5271 Transcript_3607/m.5271 type:complete len:109 (-) Transcript_3607:197-523(-)